MEKKKSNMETRFTSINIKSGLIHIQLSAESKGKALNYQSV